MNMGTLIYNLFMIFLMIFVGIFAGKTKMVNSKAQGDFTAFLMNIAVPCLVFSSMIREYNSSLIRDTVIIFLLGLLFFGGALVLNQWTVAWFKVSPGRRNVWTVSVSLSNTGFVGFPLVRAVFGEEGLFLAAMMNLAYNCVCWSYGAKVMTKGTDQAASTDWKKILLSNINLAVFLGFPCFLLRLSPPAPVMTVIRDFGNITTPLSMFLIGLNLSQGKLREVFTDRDVYTITLMRLVGMPLLILLILRLLPLPGDSILKGVALIITAMPCPSAGMMLAQRYGQDADLASRAIFLSSLCCIVTIPLIMLLL